MNFDFFTFGGLYYWEDVFNYHNWVIQKNVKTNKYRLLDNHNIRRYAGSFEECKNTLLKYIEAYELPHTYDDSIILLHDFAKTKKSMKAIADSLRDIKANIITINYTSLLKGVNYHSTSLSAFIKNLQNKNNLYFINDGAGCLILRKMLGACNNFRSLKIKGIIDINPINSGSEIAEILKKNKLCQHLLGPMLSDISIKKATLIPKLPKDIPHGIIFSPSRRARFLKRLFSRYESIPPLTPPSEQSYARNVTWIKHIGSSSLNNTELFLQCKHFIEEGSFIDTENNSR